VKDEKHQAVDEHPLGPGGDQRGSDDRVGPLRRIDDIVSDEVPVGGPSPETV
jgi:hypothetical protein